MKRAKVKTLLRIWFVNKYRLNFLSLKIAENSDMSWHLFKGEPTEMAVV